MIGNWMHLMKSPGNNALLDYYTLIYQYQKGQTETLASTLAYHVVEEPEYRDQHRRHPLGLRTMNHNHMEPNTSLAQLQVLAAEKVFLTLKAALHI